jgi:hypothetical protein
MAFDGSYPRSARERGRAHRIFVRRARCGRCGKGEALLPDFLLCRRQHTAPAVGAAVLAPSGALPEGAASLYEGVPARTVRSWRQRFAQHADQLAAHFDALTVERGSQLPLPVDPPTWSPARRATASIGRFWSAARRRQANVPPAWPLANVVVGGQLLAARVDLPWPAGAGRPRRPRGP